MPSEILIPFALDANGKIAVETNPDRQIRQHVLSLVNTSPSERVVLGDYGVPLSHHLFENDAASVANEVGNLVSAAFATWEPGVGLTGVTTSASGANSEQANFTANFKRLDAPDSNLSVAANINTALITSGGRVSEVVSA